MAPQTFVAFTPDRDDPSWRQGWTSAIEMSSPLGIEELPQSAFVWHNFRVTVVFKVGGVDLSKSMTDVSVSILDFALMLQAAKAITRRTGTAQIGLSDRGDEWRFSLRDDMVRVRSRCGVGSGWIDGSCPAEVFEKLVDESLTDALRLIFWEQPALRRNKYLQSLTRR
jgi:hypothetical protein